MRRAPPSRVRHERRICVTCDMFDPELLDAHAAAALAADGDIEREDPGHSPAHARRTTAAIFTREGHTQLVAACPAGRPHEASLEVPATREPLELLPNELRQRMTDLLEACDESRQMPPHQYGSFAAMSIPGMTTMACNCLRQ